MGVDKSLCKYYGRKHESLAYNWPLGRAMVLGSLQCLGVLLFCVIAGQGSAVLAFFSLIYPVFICLFLFSADTAWPGYNVVDWAVD